MLIKKPELFILLRGIFDVFLAFWLSDKVLQRPAIFVVVFFNDNVSGCQYQSEINQYIISNTSALLISEGSVRKSIGRFGIKQTGVA